MRMRSSVSVVHTCSRGSERTSREAHHCTTRSRAAPHARSHPVGCGTTNSPADACTSVRMRARSTPPCIVFRCSDSSIIVRPLVLCQIPCGSRRSTSMCSRLGHLPPVGAAQSSAVVSVGSCKWAHTNLIAPKAIAAMEFMERAQRERQLEVRHWQHCRSTTAHLLAAGIHAAAAAAAAPANFLASEEDEDAICHSRTQRRASGAAGRQRNSTALERLAMRARPSEQVGRVFDKHVCASVRLPTLAIMPSHWVKPTR